MPKSDRPTATRTHKKVEAELVGENRRSFMRSLLLDLRALERMIREGRIETGICRFGAEQEVFLVDRSWSPAPGALSLLERLDDPHFTTELGLFNLELNADPLLFSGDGLSRMERQIAGLLEKLRDACHALDLHPVLTGILPTVRKSDLGLDNMVPSPRYQALNRAMGALRGEAYEFSINGIDELAVKHDSVMVEACTASFQVHLQVSAEDFARMYNVAQVVAGPLMSVTANSPLLFGKRLWAETRIALFQQAVDTRTASHHLREQSGRGSFGTRWVQQSILEIYKEDVARFRALVGTDLDEDPMELLDKGQTPELKALRLHNGTVYRWNRACYGIIDGVPHLRIENRIMPSGPSLLDEIANAAYWLGVMTEMGATYEDITRHIEFDHAQANFYAAAHAGIGAQLTWLDGAEVSAQDLTLTKLLPMAEAGLRRRGVVEEDISRYLGVVEQRARSTRTGTKWMLTSLAAMKSKGTAAERLNALVAATVARQGTGRPVSEWERARLDEAERSRDNYRRVDHYMTTDIFTVQQDDAIDLVADLMGWERIRHVPVEDRDHRLVGLVSYRAVLRHLVASKLLRNGQGKSVADIMRTDVLTVTPQTPTLEAIALMRRYRVGCLPVVQDERLVGIVTEEDFMDIAAALLEHRLSQETEGDRRDGKSEEPDEEDPSK